MDRNRLKRLTRELFRRYRPRLPHGDFLIYWKGDGEDLKALREELQGALGELTRRTDPRR